ncbi:hypothetical protein [Pseudomonas sp. R5-89-07]|uniref:hypothetical protein n=1 Tax=Pseudomonas sp. R5-89-07 TaxID=658644 RepID=UPI000F58DDA5|nr:hypothetical protein [Pseudomonas sp. R5-89-07]
MSVSASNQAFASSTDNLPQTRADAPASPVVKAAGAAGPSFEQSASQSGPVFDSAAQSSKPGFNPGPPLRPNPTLSGPPPRPNPTLPDPYYGKQSNELLAQGLLNKYNVFKPWYAPTVTPEHINNMAGRPLTGYPERDANIRLARELLKRPGLMQALDRNDGTGALDQSLSKEDISKFILSSNPLKLQDDRQLAQNVLNHFSALKGPRWSADRNAIDVNTFAKYASRPLYGHGPTDSITLLSREIMARSELKGSMDNVFGFLRDGKITREDLYRLLR